MTVHSYPLQSSSQNLSNDEIFTQFFAYLQTKNLELYDTQEEAILSLLENQNVILNTPTGSGKSLVAKAMAFYAISRGRRIYYTCPIKALVNEKFLDFAKDFGPKNVGLSTGDASVNTDAPIICCTAEILANICLREGEGANVQDIIMDEFHYYSDRDRGTAWQIPLLILNYGRFLLMSATMSDCDSFANILTQRTNLPTAIVQSTERPVPLNFSYQETPLNETLMDLVTNGEAPIYLVSFTQRECAELANGLLSIDVSSKEQKKEIAQQLKGQKFNSPYGKELQKLLRHGIGIHHAGMLPKYRLAVEKLAQKGLLKIICGTDTLGVGINVPIRSVVFTKLCKFDGKKVGILSIRDFQQIAGRAGRKGFDESGNVLIQAPEHVIENKVLERKAAGDPKKLKKLNRKQPPQRGYAHYDEKTFQKLVESPVEPLKSSFQINHGFMLNVLSGKEDGCSEMKRIVKDCHESDEMKIRLRKQAFKIFRSLAERNLITINKNSSPKITVNVELQDTFSIFQDLAIWLIDAIDALDKDDENYHLTLLSLIEAICENPKAILFKQIDKLKRDKLAALKAEGVDYDERMEILENITYPKPHAEFIYNSFNIFRHAHPWLETENIQPKSIARELYESNMSFDEYIKEYGLQRSEGLLLRYLSEVHKILTQTVPENSLNDEAKEMIHFISTVVKIVDSSLLTEWTALLDPNASASSKSAETSKAETISDRELKILITNELQRIVRLLSRRDYRTLIENIAEKNNDGIRWTTNQIESLMEPYYNERQEILLSRGNFSNHNMQWTLTDDRWSIHCKLFDNLEFNDWEVVCSVDPNQIKETHEVVLTLQDIKEI